MRSKLAFGYYFMLLLFRCNKTWPLKPLSSRPRSLGIQQRLLSGAESSEVALSSSTMTNNNNKLVQAKIISTDRISECGARLRKGELVAFPTETVYGLGAHALDSNAIPKVFKAKERPLSDPLIVHVLEAKDALELWEEDTNPALLCLTEAFWPGPLTIVAKAKSHVPEIVMANTGFVACRCPSHTIARDLLRHAQVPVVAPSANKFGHVSPTRAEHVFDDLRYEDVWIVESKEICDIGVESTIAKVTDGMNVVILRQGAVAAKDIKSCLHNAGLTDCVVTSKSKTVIPDHVEAAAPGQMLRHYSPNIPSYIVSTSLAQTDLTLESRSKLQCTVVIDYGSQLAHWQEFSLKYKDLSPNNTPGDATQALFDTLRWAERVQNAEFILFPNIEGSDALLLALKDRLTRAASGVEIDSLV